MLCDVTLIYAELYTLMIFFAKWHVLASKFIEINNNIEVNSFSIFRVNLKFSVRVQINTLVCSKNIGKDYERFLV